MTDQPKHSGSLFDRIGHHMRRQFRGPIRYFHLHILLITAIIMAIAFAIGFSGGFVTGTKYDQAYFRGHYKATQPIPQSRVAVHVPGSPVSVPSSGGITISRYPAVGNQDGIGACAAWASAWAISYEYRMTHPKPHPWIKFSPRCLYDHYSDTYNNGQDGGSWPDQDTELIPSQGIARFDAVPEPPNVIDNPVPATCFNTTYRFPVSWEILSGFSQGGGQGLLDLMRQHLSQGQPILVALPVYPEYDAAAQNGGFVTSPRPGENSRGGHENVALAYDDNLRFPDGSVGGVLVQNQWTTQWGNHGRAWFSYDFVRQYVFGAEVPHINNQTTGATKGAETRLSKFVPNHAPKHLPFPDPGHRTGAKTLAGGWYVHNVVTLDTGLDVTSAFNAAGDQYHVWPVGLVATALTESGLHQYADRCCIPGDTSYGMMQFTLGTACGYGVCSNIRDNLDNPYTSILMAARYYADAVRQLGISWDNLYIAYNAGSGQYLGFYTNPTGVAYQNFYYNFEPNMRVAQARYMGGSPPPTPKPKPIYHPKPKPFYFNFGGYEEWRDQHHEKRLSPWAPKGGLTWPASFYSSYPWLGGIRYKGLYITHLPERRGDQIVQVKIHPLYKYGFENGHCYGYFNHTFHCGGGTKSVTGLLPKTLSP